MEPMNLAIEEACKGVMKREGGPFGAVIVRGDEIISIAHNTVLASNDPTAHAEINAIRSAAAKLKTFNLSDCTLYASCHPCPMCIGATLWARIATVYYAASPDEAARVGFSDADFHDFIRNPKSNQALRIEPAEIQESVLKKPFDMWVSLDSNTMY